MQKQETELYIQYDLNYLKKKHKWVCDYKYTATLMKMNQNTEAIT